jgi:hypothetical protein
MTAGEGMIASGPICRGSRQRAWPRGHIVTKTVFVNDEPIGRASTWREVYELVVVEGFQFTAKPGAAEGPTGFYLHGTLRSVGKGESISADSVGAA